jgi:hypothetical protein
MTFTQNHGEYGGWNFSLWKLAICKRSYGFDYRWGNKCILTSGRFYVIINGTIIAYVFGEIRAKHANGVPWFRIPIRPHSK